jgi:ATP-dependent Clp protease ATP-binding subunit ClpA
MFERFTDKARQVVSQAPDEARQLGTRYVGTEHLLLALMECPGIAHDVLATTGLDPARVRAELEPMYRGDAEALETIGIDLDAVRAKVEAAFGPGALDEPPEREKTGWFRRRNAKDARSPFTPRSKKVLELSLREALALKHNYIGTEHILLGLIREGEGLAASILTDAGINLPQLRQKTIDAVQAAL